MSDPRNVAHDKKVTQEKKHQGAAASATDVPAVQPGKKPAVAKKSDQVDTAVVTDELATDESAAPLDGPAATPPALEGSLVVLAKLKELEFHSRASLERLAELGLTVEDELKQKAFVGPLADVYAAQSGFQTAITALIEAYKTECDRMKEGHA